MWKNEFNSGVCESVLFHPFLYIYIYIYLPLHLDLTRLCLKNYCQFISRFEEQNKNIPKFLTAIYIKKRKLKVNVYVSILYFTGQKLVFASVTKMKIL